MARPMTAAETRAAFKKWQVQYREFPDWTTRGRDFVDPNLAFDDIRGLMIHHTGSDSQSDSYLDWIFTDGRASEGIPAPLCHVSTDMDGDVWVGAIGRANHAGKGSSSTLNAVTAENYRGFSAEIGPGPDNTDGNAHFYGNEVRYDGGQPMAPQQYASAVRWAAAICDHYGWTALSVIGHREWTTRKNDPGLCPMAKFRTDVAVLLKAGPPTPQEDPMADLRNDIVGNDADNSNMTMAEMAARLDNAYRRLLTDGFVGQALIDIQATLADVVARLVRIEDDTDGTP